MELDVNSIIGYGGEGDLVLFIDPLPGEPELDGFLYSPSSGEISLMSQGIMVGTYRFEGQIGAELLSAGYRRTLLVVEQHQSAGRILRESPVPPFNGGGRRS